jgi:glycosyltransferase involved in cell wall biosynthesis
VTVVVPAWNAERTLAATLRSAIAQTYRPIEIVVVDDGSNDRTGEVARDFAAIHREVTIVRQDNGGAAAARNAGIRAATGTYIAPLDADDLWHPSKLAKQVAVFAAFPRTCLVYTWVRYIDAADRVLHDGDPQAFPPQALARHLCEDLLGSSSSIMVPRRLAIAAGGYERGWDAWEDLLFQLRVLAMGEVRFVPEYLVGYRVRAQSMSSEPARMIAGWQRARVRLKGEFNFIPHRVHRWANAARLLTFARRAAALGHRLQAAGLLVEALRDDAGRVLRFFAERATSLSGAATAPRDPFLGCDPAVGQPPANACPAHFEHRRRRHLEAIDRSLRRP